MNDGGYRAETGWEFCNRLSAVYQELCNKGEPSFLEVKRWLMAATEGVLHNVNLTLIHNNHPDYQALRFFLSLRGPLWQAGFFLSKHSVDVWTRVGGGENAEEPLTPVTALHYILIHFLHHIVRFSANDPAETAACLYIQLLQEYVDEFLPSHGDYGGQLMRNRGEWTGEGGGVGASEWEDKVQPISPLFSRSALQSRTRSPKPVPIPSSTESLPIQETKTFMGSIASLWLSPSSPPTQLLAIALRYVLKQVHQFASSPSSLNDSSLKHLKASLPRMMAPELFSFLLRQFQRWPLDSSFRVILETWLTFIQPWRYTSTGSQERERERWRGFVTEHWDFYAVFFHLSAQRLGRMDLSSGRNVLLLSRLAKVFCSEPVAQLFTEQAASVSGNNSSCGPFGFQQDSEVHAAIQMLLDKIEYSQSALQLRLQQVEAEASREADKRKSFWYRMFGEESGIQEEVKETKKAIAELGTVGKNFGKHFSLSFQSHLDSEDPSLGLSQLDATFSHPDSGKMDPDSCLDPRTNRAILTPLGRSQVLSKSRRFTFENPVDLTYAPDLAPIGKSEISVLARWLCAASICLSLRLKESIETIYSSKGTLARWFILPPSRDYAVGSPKMSGEGEVLFPRINPPRFLASIKFLIWLIIFLLTVRSFGFGLVPGLFCGFLGFCFSQCC